MIMQTSCIVLDRDGVINEDSVSFVNTPEAWLPIPGSLEAITQLNRAGYPVVVATNQSGIGRGLFSPETLTAIHQKMCAALSQYGGHIDGIFHCPHHPNDGCHCRKPKPGLLHAIQAQFGTPFDQTLVIGDALRDITAAQSVGCQAALVKTGKGLKTAQTHANLLLGVPQFEDLSDAVRCLLTLR